jgi:hypothetical protein
MPLAFVTMSEGGVEVVEAALIWRSACVDFRYRKLGKAVHRRMLSEPVTQAARKLLTRR